MLSKKTKNRSLIFSLFSLFLIISVFLSIKVLDDNVLYFLSPTEIKNLSELNQKESPRLEWGAKILNNMGIKTIIKHNSIKIFGNPKVKLKKKIIIKNFLKDHRVFMTSVIAALSFGGSWEIHNKESIKRYMELIIKKEGKASCKRLISS